MSFASNQQWDATPTRQSACFSKASYSAPDACALRSRRQSRAIAARITSGSSRNGRKFQLASENVRRSLFALTVAVRVPASSKAISPTASPGPNTVRCAPCANTSAVPSRMRKNRPAPSPSAKTSAPAWNDITFPALQILFSCFCGRSRNNSEACNAAMISSVIRLTFQVRTTISKSEESAGGPYTAVSRCQLPSENVIIDDLSASLLEPHGGSAA